jgi:hypothetical protein
MSRTLCYELFKRFKGSRMSVGEDPRPGRHSTSTNYDHDDRVRAVIRGNRRLTVRDVADEVGISIGSCHQIFTEKLQMRGVSAICTGSRVAPHPQLSGQHQTSDVPHPTYSPDPSLADVFLFSKLKTTLKGRRFQTIEEIHENEIPELRAITESAFQETF